MASSSDPSPVPNDELLAIAGRIAGFGGWQITIADGRVYWSDEVCRIHGEPPGTTISVDEGVAYYAPEWRPTIREHFTRCVEEGVPYDLELELVTREGRRVWVRAIGEPVTGPDGSVVAVQGAFQDLTAQKEKEARIAGLEARLTRVLDSMSDAFFTLDREWRFTFMNDAATRLLERPAEELLGTNVWEEFPAAVDGDFYQEYHRAVSSGRSVQFEDHYAPLDRWFSVNAYPSEDGLAVYFRDVTEPRRTEERFQAALEAAEIGAFDWPMGEEAGWVSDSLFAILGLEPAGNRVSLAQWLELVVPEDRERVMQELESVAQGGAAHQTDFRIIRPDGKVRDIRSRAQAIRGGAPGPTRLIGALADVTERRVTEERLRAAQRMEAIGQLSGGVAHDFNNLLTVVQGGAHTLLEELPPDSPLRPVVEECLEAAEGGAKLTRQLLAFGRKQVSENRVLDAGVLVGELGPMLRRTTPASVELELAVEGSTLSVEADPHHLRQVLLNLVSNGVDATGGQGRIELAADRSVLSKEEAEALPWEAAEGAYVRLTVRDDGAGMPPEVLDRIFEPFFTTKPPGHGTGLGLPMVYGIVKEAGGHILVESEPGKGSTFQVLLPAVDQEAEPAKAKWSEAGRADTKGSGTEPASPGTPASSAPIRVLLVEDDDAVRKAVARMLDRLGCEVIEAENGTHALEMEARHRGKIDLVLSDVIMGDLDGPSVVQRIREKSPDLPGVFMSGYLSDELAERARQEAAAFLSKPFTPEALEEAIRAAVAGNGGS